MSSPLDEERSKEGGLLVVWLVNRGSTVLSLVVLLVLSKF